jgi:putative colanic acid biosynthesis acetyltransferase WcaF
MPLPQDLSLYDNSWYSHGKSKTVRLLWILCNALFLENPLSLSSGFKVRLLRLFGAKIGVGVLIKPKVTVKHPWMLSIGNHVWIGEGVWIDNLGFVNIDDHVCISQGALLLCGNHNYRKLTFDLMVGAIHLEQGSWIGAKCVICPGVTVGAGAVIGVGSVATKNLDADMIYQGNPAVAVRKRGKDS